MQCSSRICTQKICADGSRIAGGLFRSSPYFTLSRLHHLVFVTGSGSLFRTHYKFFMIQECNCSTVSPGTFAPKLLTTQGKVNFLFQKLLCQTPCVKTCIPLRKKKGQ